MKALASRIVIVGLLLATCTAASTAAEEPKLTLEKGDRICLIGNTLAERMQYFGHFETLLHARFPDHQLVVRNLGWSADELDVRPRSQNFGSPDSHLTHSRADVVLAFFGFNEAFAGPPGVSKFEERLRAFIHHTRGQKYNGRTAPRLVLVSPIAFENTGDPNLPDGSDANRNIHLYSVAMAKVASELDVPFVDLFTPTQAVMEKATGNLTFNGIHLTDDGYRQLAPILDESLFGAPANGERATEDLRAAVNEKSFQWFHRYRAVNGFYIYGGRSNLWENDKVMANERAKLDEMTALRDERIWQIAQGKSVPAEIDDSQTRPLTDVPTNYDGVVKYLSPEEACEAFSIADGYELNCFASEVDFPELANPVQMTFDAKGRLWVCTMASYPQYTPPDKPNDQLLILEDTNNDGKADICKVFAGGLHLPTGFELGDGGVYVAQQPNLLFLKDTTGDDRADFREIVLHGFDSADSHHSISTFTWGPGGELYFMEGTFHHSQIETPYGPQRLKDAGVFRWEPKSHKLDVFISYGFANPWGHVFDAWGQNFVADASGGANYYAAAFSGHVDHSRKRPGMNQFLPKRVRPTAGCEIVSSRHFPDEAQGNFLLNNCIGFQGVLQHRMSDDGSGFKAVEVEPLLISQDPNFRPTDLQFGPDGALYIVDWHNVLVGHMQHSLRDPNRDTKHGRVWRLTYKDKPLLEKPRIAGEPIPALLEMLKTHEDRTRYRVRLELRERDAEEVAAELRKWIASLDKNDPNHQHHLLESLWVHQGIHRVNQDLLKQLLRSPDHRARAAATRVLCYWRDAVSEPLELLRQQAGDEHPRVRLEAVRACSFFPQPEAADVAMESLNHPQDYYLEYALNETLKTLDVERRLRPTAAKAVVRIEPVDRETAEKLAASEQPIATRMKGVAALARLDVDAAASRAAGVLQDAKPSSDLAPLVDAFLGLQGGADKLAAALAEGTLSPDMAKRVLRHMYAIGRTDEQLVELLKTAAGVGEQMKPLSPEEKQQLIAEVIAKGDPVRGEDIFRHEDLNCLKCHAVAGAGGDIGPELSGLGVSSPIEYILESLLEPAKAVKEEYQTSTVLDEYGKVHLGIVVERDDEQLVLKDATGKRTTILVDDVLEERKGGSLMPDGLTAFLTRDELVDLTRFISELGKPGPYAVRATPTMQRWRALSETADELSAGVPEEAAFRTSVLQSPAEQWEAVYGRVSGDLPLNELVRPDRRVLYVQGELEVTSPGRAALTINSPEGLHVWVGDQPIAPATRMEFDVVEGIQAVTFRVDVERRGTDSLRAELAPVAGSEAAVTVVRGR